MWSIISKCSIRLFPEMLPRVVYNLSNNCYAKFTCDGLSVIVEVLVLRCRCKLLCSPRLIGVFQKWPGSAGCWLDSEIVRAGGARGAAVASQVRSDKQPAAMARWCRPGRHAAREWNAYPEIASPIHSLDSRMLDSQLVIARNIK